MTLPIEPVYYLDIYTWNKPGGQQGHTGKMYIHKETPGEHVQMAVHTFCDPTRRGRDYPGITDWTMTSSLVYTKPVSTNPESGLTWVNFGRLSFEELVAELHAFPYVQQMLMQREV